MMALMAMAVWQGPSSNLTTGLMIRVALIGKLRTVCSRAEVHCRRQIHGCGFYCISVGSGRTYVTRGAPCRRGRYMATTELILLLLLLILLPLFFWCFYDTGQCDAMPVVVMCKANVSICHRHAFFKLSCNIASLWLGLLQKMSWFVGLYEEYTYKHSTRKQTCYEKVSLEGQPPPAHSLKTSFQKMKKMAKIDDDNGNDDNGVIQPEWSKWGSDANWMASGAVRFGVNV